MKDIGLVLEGGGMRGLYTAGVLEYFLEQRLFFPYVIGVSAGACMAASYLSKQEGRNKRVNTGLVRDPRYLSFRNFLWKRQLFGMDFLFDEIPNKIIPLDFETFLGGAGQFVVGTTDCETGEAIYYNKREHGADMLTIIRASSSLPLLAPPVEYDGRRLLDGGMVAPIPIQKAKQDGFLRNIVIMTRPAGYNKAPSKLSSLVTTLYRKHPKVASALREHYALYNTILSQLDMDQRAGNCFIIQPSVTLPVSRIERNEQRLVALYELGYEDAKRQMNDIQRWAQQ